MSRLKELIAELCPDGVSTRRLVSVADVLYGAPFNSALFNESGLGLPLIRIRDVVNRYSSTYYSGDYDSRYVIQDGDILLGMDGNFNMRTWRDGEALLNQRVCRISTKDDSTTLNGYLYYYLSPLFKEMEQRIIGSTVAHLSARAINEVYISLPPIEVQREIVRILDSFQELDDALTAEIEAREKQLGVLLDRGVYQLLGNRACVHPLKDALGVKGYIRGPFGSALRKADMVSEGIPVYEQQHAIYNHRDFRYYVTEEKAKKLSRFKTMPGDIILSCSGTIGMCSVITDDDAIGIINQALLILRPNKTVLTMYLYWFLKSSYGHSSVLSRTAGSAQPNLSSRKEIEAIPFPLPTISVQEAFVSQLSHVNSYLGLLYAEREARRKQFAYYRDKLLAFPEKVAS